jgi:hydroxymethylglutaryl-CoA reductase (NADPH)
MQYHHVATVPLEFVGPIKIIGTEVCDEIKVPMATFETPLWPSTNRGARATFLSGGIKSTIIDESMSRSIVLEAVDAAHAVTIISALKSQHIAIEEIVRKTSRFAQLKDWHTQVVGNLLFIRFSLTTGDASGHNMATSAAEAILNWILQEYPTMQYVSISGNFFTYKKVSAVNGILGRGKYVVAEVILPRNICNGVLKTTPEKVVNLHIKKNLIGTMLAGGLRSANAHFANMLLAVYLATGQDVANIVEGSQGMVHAEVRGQDLYFSVTLPNIIVGTIGNGKHLEFAKNNLQAMGCLEAREAGVNARRLAIIVACSVLCGELSLLAAQTNPGELMRTHLLLERKKGLDQANA